MLPSPQPLTYAVVIPARYKSTRFPGKPLALLYGKPMIQRVWELCCKAVEPSMVYVATDDARIKQVCESFGAQVLMTPESCMTGTDRLAYANKFLNKDFIINVQGDEPLVNPDDINKVKSAYLDSPGVVVNAMCKILTSDEHSSLSVPKVVVSSSGTLLYISRAPVPLNKKGKFQGAMKQVCIYAFSAEHLEFFASHSDRTPLEAIEDIEILRFLENDILVKMVEVDAGSIAVDTEEDARKVLGLIKQFEDSTR